MKTKFDWLIALSILSGLVSCGEKESAGIPDFPYEGVAEMTVIGDDMILPYIEKIFVTDSSVIVSGLLDDHWIHEYDRKTGEPKGHHVMQGQGPGDITACSGFKKSDHGWKIYDYMTRRVKSYNPDFSFRSLSDEDSLLYQKYENLLLGGISFHNGDKVMYTIGVPDGDFAKEGFLVASHGNLGKPYFGTPVDDDPSKKLFYRRARIACSPDGKNMVIASYPACYMDIYDISDNDIHPRSSHPFYPLKIEDPDDWGRIYKDNIRGFAALAVTDSRIVASVNLNPDKEGPCEILVWDWDGKPQRRYKTNACVICIALSPDNSEEIYAYIKDDEMADRLAVLNCPGLLD